MNEGRFPAGGREIPLSFVFLDIYLQGTAF